MQYFAERDRNHFFFFWLAVYRSVSWAAAVPDGGRSRTGGGAPNQQGRAGEYPMVVDRRDGRGRKQSKVKEVNNVFQRGEKKAISWFTGVWLQWSDANE